MSISIVYNTLDLNLLIRLVFTKSFNKIFRASSEQKKKNWGEEIKGCISCSEAINATLLVANDCGTKSTKPNKYIKLLIFDKS